MWPIPIYWDGKRYRPTVAGMDYSCGVAALIARVAAEQKALGAPPAQWEAFNEPDARRSYNGTLRAACRGPRNSCGASYPTLCGPRVGAECGPLQAAWLYTTVASALRAQRIPGKVAAGTFSKTGSYADAYMRQLIGTLHARPAVISFHDYVDPTANSTAVAHAFAVRLSKEFGKRFELWITESGVYLSEPTLLPREGGSSRSHGCEFGTSRQPGLVSLGRCIDGNSRAQAAGAASFKHRLAQLGSYGGVRITELFRSSGTPVCSMHKERRAPATARSSPGPAAQATRIAIADRSADSQPDRRHPPPPPRVASRVHGEMAVFAQRVQFRRILGIRASGCEYRLPVVDVSRGFAAVLAAAAGGQKPRRVRRRDHREGSQVRGRRDHREGSQVREPRGRPCAHSRRWGAPGPCVSPRNRADLDHTACSRYMTTTPTGTATSTTTVVTAASTTILARRVQRASRVRTTTTPAERRPSIGTRCWAMSAHRPAAPSKQSYTQLRAAP
jgi:hypothetical protein